MAINVSTSLDAALAARAASTVALRASAVPGLSGLSAGVLLTARVERGAAAGQVAQLRLGAPAEGVSVSAASARALHTGAELRLQVLRTRPGIEMQVLDDVARGAIEPVTRAGLRQALPTQQPLGQALARLTQVAAALAARDAPQGGGTPTAAGVTAELAREIRTLTAGLLDPRSAMAAAPEDGATRVRAAIQDSGSFLEARLAAAAAGLRRDALSSDLKAALLRLRGQLEALPSTAPAAARALPAAGGSAGGPGVPTAPPPPPSGDLAQLLDGARQGVESGIARIETNQLLSVRTPADAAVVYLDLPLRQGGDIADARISLRRERRGGGEDGESVSWSATLELAPPGLGPMTARVSLRGEQVSTALVAASESSRERLAQGLPALRAQLEASGLEVGRLSAHRGPVAEADALPAAPPELVSVKA